MKNQRRNFGKLLAQAGIATSVLGQSILEKVFKENVYLPKNAEVLDVGCHGGSLSFFLASFLDVKVTGIDKESLAIDLATNLSSEYSSLGKISFLNQDVMSLLLDKKYDLLVHRGLEAFFEKEGEFISKISQLTKTYGYIINITHLYKSEDKSLIQELNENLGMNVKYLSVQDIISKYKENGLSLLHHEYFDVQEINLPREREIISRLSIANTAKEELVKCLEVIARNESNTFGNIFIFRKMDSALIGIESAKA